MWPAPLAEKGFPREPLKIIEICNANYASQVLNKDVKISLMLPCPISVYVQSGKTEISTLLPSSIAEFFPRAGIEGLAAGGGERRLENHRRGALITFPVCRNRDDPPLQFSLRPGGLLALDRGVPHDIEALEESAFLLTLAWPGRC